MDLVKKQVQKTISHTNWNGILENAGISGFPSLHAKMTPTFTKKLTKDAVDNLTDQLVSTQLESSVPMEEEPISNHHNDKEEDEDGSSSDINDEELQKFIATSVASAVSHTLATLGRATQSKGKREKISAIGSVPWSSVEGKLPVSGVSGVAGKVRRKKAVYKYRSTGSPRACSRTDGKKKHFLFPVSCQLLVLSPFVILLSV